MKIKREFVEEPFKLTCLFYETKLYCLSIYTGLRDWN